MNILLSTAYFAPVEYYVHLLKADSVLIERYETFPKQTFRNRCVILSANGPLTLSVPLHQRKNHSLTKDIQISYSVNWQDIHWKTIESAYNSSPFFEYYSDEIRPFFELEEDYLIDFNEKIQNTLLELLSINLRAARTQAYIKDTTGLIDLRTGIKNGHLNLSLPPYIQVFNTKFPFTPNLSILDLLFNLGPEAKEYLENCPLKLQ